MNFLMGYLVIVEFITTGYIFYFVVYKAVQYNRKRRDTIVEQ